MARMPGAVWDPLAPDWNRQPRMRAHNFVCIHTMVGSLQGTDDLFRFRNGRGYDGTESHYGTGHDGRIEQWQDTAHRAEANLDGNGDVISIENADFGIGFPWWDVNDGSQVPAFTDDQVEAIAEILAWECSPAAHAGCPPSWECHRSGIPLELVPDTKPGRRGVAYHRQGIDPWRVPGGTRWSGSRGKVCPGDRRIAQIPRIIARARQLTAGETVSPPAPLLGPTLVLEDDMLLVNITSDDGKQYKGTWLQDSIGYHNSGGTKVVAQLRAKGCPEITVTYSVHEEWKAAAQQGTSPAMEALREEIAELRALLPQSPA